MAPGPPAHPDVFHAFTQGILEIRTSRLVSVFVPSFGMLLTLREAPNVSAQHQIVAGGVPFLLLISLAATCPDGLPATSVGYVIAIFLGLAALDFRKVTPLWQTSRQHCGEDCHVRALVACIWIVGNLALAVYLWQRGHESPSFWAGLRTNLCVGNGGRLVVVLTLRATRRQSEDLIYPPGYLDFTTSLRFHLCCLALATVGLSPRCRHLLSDWTNAARLDLASIPGKSELEPPTAVPLAAHPAEKQPSDALSSFCTLSMASTINPDDQFDFSNPERPLNALHATETALFHLSMLTRRA